MQLVHKSAMPIRGRIGFSIDDGGVRSHCAGMMQTSAPNAGVPVADRGERSKELS
jgi:hypothetical protein